MKKMIFDRYLTPYGKKVVGMIILIIAIWVVYEGLSSQVIQD
jgi:hypothetical protein